MKNFLLAFAFVCVFFPSLARAADNYAVIDTSGNVVNVIVWDGASNVNLPVGQSLIIGTAAGTTAQIGGKFANGTFAAPPPPAPYTPPIDPIVALTTLLVQQGVLQVSDVNTAMTGTPQASSISTSLSAIAAPLNTTAPVTLP